MDWIGIGRAVLYTDGVQEMDGGMFKSLRQDIQKKFGLSCKVRHVDQDAEIGTQVLYCGVTDSMQAWKETHSSILEFIELKGLGRIYDDTCEALTVEEFQDTES